MVYFNRSEFFDLYGVLLHCCFLVFSSRMPIIRHVVTVWRIIVGKYSDDGLRPLIEKNKRFDSICIYCRANVANSREHLPSRVFLDTPYPEQYSIVPACEKCNGGFSADEVYVSSFIDKLRSTLSNNEFLLRENTIATINHDKELAKILNEQIRTENGRILVNYVPESFSKILIKLAKGHLCQEQDRFIKSDCLVECNFKFKPDLSEDEIYHFEELPLADKASECGSDFTHGLLIVEDIGFPSQIFVPWNQVQDGNYRYLTYFDP